MKFIANINVNCNLQVTVEANNLADAKAAINEYIDNEQYSMFDLNIDEAYLDEIKEEAGNEGRYSDDEISYSDYFDDEDDEDPEE